MVRDDVSALLRSPVVDLVALRQNCVKSSTFRNSMMPIFSVYLRKVETFDINDCYSDMP